MERGEMPVGLGMALAQDPEAMKKFAMLSSTEQEKIAAEIQDIHSKQEMHQYVNDLLSRY